jgi:cytochrome P450
MGNPYKALLSQKSRKFDGEIQLIVPKSTCAHKMWDWSYLTHHREDIYPDPDEFRPERFLERRYSPYEYLPFGGGVRRCIGMAFAQFEMKLVISGILSNFELALAESRSVRPVRRGLIAGPSPFRMVVKEHRPC